MDQRDPKEPMALDEEELMTSGNRLSYKDFGFQKSHGFKNFPGCRGQGRAPLVLLFLSLVVFAGLLVAILVQVSKVPRSQGLEPSKQEEIQQILTQLKAGIALLCHPCPWGWRSFQGNCYFFSNSQLNWHDSVTACEEVEAQLVVIESAEEQNFLQVQASRFNRLTWMGLSDLKHEGTWHWVDGSPLLPSFMKYWNEGEPNSSGEEDCAEFRGKGWNDSKCSLSKFWICKKPTTSCSSA
ncbi:CD209 antigen [Equus quagga]|uniref:CD209 antigen n=1 Tax=Equus quagga TaxID=89248 RepID=UPI001EE1E49B|nr:CD209 antigen [Equus quagga]